MIYLPVLRARITPSKIKLYQQSLVFGMCALTYVIIETVKTIDNNNNNMLRAQKTQRSK